MKRRKIFGALICAGLVLMSTLAASAETSFYTYTYDYWNEEQASPNAYEVAEVYVGSDFGTTNFKNPQGLFSIGDRLYVCDTDNDRIVVLKRAEEGFELDTIITEFMHDGEVDTFDEPYDCFVKEDGTIYVCDYGNLRIVILNSDLECIQVVDNPEDETIEEGFKFGAQKMVVDDTGRMYVLVESVNKGFMAFDPDGSFTGYIGANKVTYSLWDRFWKTVATEAQKDQMVNFVPTEYNNIALSNDGFFMATTSTFDESDLRSETVNPIRKLNAMGTDILIRNGYTQPMGDLTYGNAAGYNGSSRFVDVVTMENGTYYLLDQTRCRIFAYDSQGNLLYGFGGPGNKEGYFQYPSALEQNDTDLFVLDDSAGTLTMLSTTDYGQLINKAIEEYQVGYYDQSADTWREVLKYNGNYALAYIGIGRSLLRQDDYKGAMHYFKLAYDFDNYSKAFKLYRKEWIEDNIGYIFVGLVVILLIPLTINTVKKVRKEVEDVE